MSSIRSLIPKIPNLATWNKAFRNKGAAKVPRCTIADTLVAETGFKQLKGYTKWNQAEMDQMTVVEINPGLGAWTSALYNGGFNKIYSLEPVASYLKQLTVLAEQSQGAVIPLKKDGYDWKTYVELKDPAYLGPYINSDWSQVNPHILFTGTLPKSTKGEQLLAQFATCIVNKMALHSMGRIQMALWMPDQLYQKFTGPPGSYARCKMSVVTEACADIKVIYSTEPGAVYPNATYHLVHIVPIPQKKIKAEWDVFEYVLKHIFVMQKQPLSKMVRTLGPGADIILDRLDFDPSIVVGEMSAEQIDQVAVKFDQWPLRPRVLFEDSQSAI